MDDDGELECSTRSDVKSSEAEIEGAGSTRRLSALGGINTLDT